MKTPGTAAGKTQSDVAASLSLATMPATAVSRRLALGVVIASAVIFVSLAPFATVQLPRVDAFIPMYESALVINDLITAVLLLGQSAIKLLWRQIENHLPLTRSIHVDWRVLACLAGLTMLTAIIAGLVPALRAMRRVRAQGRRAAGSARLSLHESRVREIDVGRDRQAPTPKTRAALVRVTSAISAGLVPRARASASPTATTKAGSFGFPR